MKKLFAILAVAGFLTACSDGGTAEETKSDSTATTTESTTPAPDSTALQADSTKTTADSTAAQ